MDRVDWTALLAAWITLSVPASAAITGLVLFGTGTDVLIALAAGLAGAAIGGLTLLALIIVSMTFSAVEAGYGRVLGLSDSDTPSFAYLAVNALLGVLPAAFAVLGAVAASLLLEGVDRIVAQAVTATAGILVGGWLVATAISARRTARAAAAQRQQWFLDRAAEARADPELAAALEDEGWRSDGRYDDMRAAYFRAWESVKRRRRAAGRPIFGRQD